jgi:DNA-binding IclR family transcriptional regulator
MNERRDGIQVIARVASLLRALSANVEGLSPQEIADQCDIPRPTVYRLAKALATEDFVRLLPNGRILIGPGLMRVAIANTRDIRNDMRPFLEQLAREIDEHTEEAVLYAGEVLFVDQYVTRRVMRAITNVGTRGPLHCSANGKALLSSLTPQEMEDILPEKLIRLTPNTITDLDVLRAEISEVRRTGLAYDIEEYTIGVCPTSAASWATSCPSRPSSPRSTGTSTRTRSSPRWSVPGMPRRPHSERPRRWALRLRPRPGSPFLRPR